MTLDAFLDNIRNQVPVSFNDTMTVISENYHYQPTAFNNGALSSPAGTNEGSCKIFAFGLLHKLTEQQTLALFGDFYTEVLNSPKGSDHQNIRNFMQTGWQGVQLSGVALTAR